MIDRWTNTASHSYYLWGPYIAAALITLFASKLVSSVVRGWTRWRYMPPGPAGVPLLGNLPQIGKTPLRLKLAEWKEKYGKHMS
jgi:hypothetical protein